MELERQKQKVDELERLRLHAEKTLADNESQLASSAWQQS